MKNLRGVGALMAFCGALVAVTPSHAAFHFWRIKEIFSNQDGTVQFIEFFTTAGSENFLNFHTVEATSDGNLVTYSFPNESLAGSTANKHFILATSGFGDLAGGVTPDFVSTPLPNNFFNPNATSITIDFAHGSDVATFAGSLLPKDGVNSLTDTVLTPFGDTDNFVAGVNSPTNFAGAAGSVNLGGALVPGDFTGNGVVDGADLAVWRTNFGATGAPTVAQGNADADGDVDGRDFLIWQRNVGPAPITALPEPAAALLAAFAAIAAVIKARSATDLDEGAGLLHEVLPTMNREDDTPHDLRAWARAHA